ncbi:uncharacterized protein N7443_005328 [Penicillium atrosanguineum]|uniref:uncharacterized protein n=1 Tax=Penicillium atrosanguineum TaxID=1132637 RepID=UPI00238C152B|nr:uncharacterized protein N7443_005328 [Penicillium atrosanguineum]KAJ5300326.1 hypothetical protein N7443_005328 [Penicillium atrosanguineum]
MQSLGLLLLAGAGLVPAYQLPAQLENIYQTHKTDGCQNVLGRGFSAGSTGKDVSYCGDINGAIFLHTSSNSGGYADMDVDCDGADNGAGVCSNDPSGQGQTAFKDEVSKYGISDLNANIHPYVTFGNEGSRPSFNPKDYGVQPLSVMAVICNGNLHYGVWGDTNGGTSTGESSISLAKFCFPNADITGDNGYGQRDILYIAFKGKGAVPGSGADWSAQSSEAFEDSIHALGDRLVGSLGSGASAIPTPTSSGFLTLSLPTASWDISTSNPSWMSSSSWSAPRWKPTLWRRAQN